MVTGTASAVKSVRNGTEGRRVFEFYSRRQHQVHHRVSVVVKCLPHGLTQTCTDATARAALRS